MTASLLIGVLLMAVAGVAGYAVWDAGRRAPMVGRYVDADGVRLHVLELGPRDSDKPSVVLIHGASANLRDMLISLGEPLAADRRVLIVDRPGRGYSERPKDGWRLDVQARLIHAAVKACGIDKPIIVGQSLGGAVALSYALAFQDEMSGLALLAPVSHEWPGDVAWHNAAAGMPIVGFVLRRFVIPVYGRLAAKSGLKQSFAPNDAPENYYDRAGLGLLFRSEDFKSNAEDLANLKAEIRAQQGCYGALTLPVVIITGEADKTVSPSIHSERLAREIDGARLVLLPDTGHALHHAETEAIIAAIDALVA